MNSTKQRSTTIPRIIRKLGKSIPIRANKSELTPQIEPFNLFDNEPNFLETELKKAKVYAEYGVGSSTKYVLKFSDAKIICIDSDPYWMEQACSGNRNSERITSKVVDIGRTLSWGIPVDSGKPEAFKIYTNWVFEQALAPDLLLIDGRFRVCCFLTAIKKMLPGKRIIFDDYTFRRQYHFVEKFLEPKEIIGRQALFEVPLSQTWEDDYHRMALDAFRFNLN